MHRNCYRKSGIVTVLCLGALLAASAHAQDLRATLFAGTDDLIAQGNEVRAELLAPKSWGQGMDKFKAAERKLDEGKNIENIRKDLAEADRYFRDAIKATDLAMVTLAQPLKAHDDAVKVEASSTEPELWNLAAAKFAEAGRKLEEGNVNDARKRGGEAEALFRDAELAAIKTSFFDETRKLLAQADQDKVEKFAPLTLARAGSLLAEAEKALNDNRYDTDRPRSLAMEARYEAQHAIHLAKLVKMTDEKVMSREQLILEAEKPLARVAGAMDLQVGFAEGFQKPTDTIVLAIEEREAAANMQAGDLADRDARVASLSDQVAQLEAKLGGASEAQAALQGQIEAQEAARRQFAQVEAQFGREEARVLREGGSVVIRMVGMNFPSGQAVIHADQFALLTKVKQAIAVYPGAMVTIEGHTDAYGTDESNLKLSQQRADAVAQYLLANSNLSPESVKAVGYGENKPIANNETPEGRKKNRRIDVLITPAK